MLTDDPIYTAACAREHLRVDLAALAHFEATNGSPRACVVARSLDLGRSFAQEQGLRTVVLTVDYPEFWVATVIDTDGSILDRLGLQAASDDVTELVSDVEDKDLMDQWVVYGLLLVDLGIEELQSLPEPSAEPSVTLVLIIDRPESPVWFLVADHGEALRFANNEARQAGYADLDDLNARSETLEIHVSREVVR